MAWDTDATRRRIREAATAEFAAFGPDGTTMTAIATRAGVNKERIYNYFGDKRAFYESILSAELAGLAETVTPPGTGLEDIGEFAGRTFDYYCAHPELARLLLWEGLGGEPIADEENRRTIYATKVNQVTKAAQDGVLTSELPADHLVFFVISITAAWFYIPQLAHMLSGTDTCSATERARQRASVVTAACRLAVDPTVSEQ